MQDGKICPPIRPIQPTLPAAVLLHMGWTAAQKGETPDENQPPEWLEGFYLWHRVQWFGPSPIVWRRS